MQMMKERLQVFSQELENGPASIHTLLNSYIVGPVNIALGAHFATYEEVIEQLTLNQEQREALWKKVLALGPGKGRLLLFHCIRSALCYQRA